jgi:hypothetical protein
MLLDYASEEDLSALGRNLGVPRLPFLSNDDRFRSIVKALAYNPRGTMYGLELALTGMVGAGNYELYEDLIRFPNTVFIRLLDSTDTRAQGKALLLGPEWQVPTGVDHVALDYPIQDRGALQAIRWKPDTLFTDTWEDYPSSQLVEEYPGAGLTQAWRYIGGTEGVDVVLAHPGIEFVDVPTDGRYQRQLRTTENGDVSVEVLVLVPDGAAAASIATVITIADGAWEAGLTFRRLGGGLCEVGLCGDSEGWGPTAVFSIATDQWTTLQLKKVGTSQWEVYQEGALKLSGVYGAGVYDAAQSERWVTFGVMGGSGVLTPLRVKHIQLVVNDVTDLASLWGFDAARVTDHTLSIGSPDFVAGDVGRVLVISGAQAENASGGNNNGRWLITSVDSTTEVTVGGLVGQRASVDSAHPLRVTLSAEAGLHFRCPDNLGMYLQLSGSVLGNNGSWLINKLLDPDTLEDLGAFIPPAAQDTAVCEVVGASFVSEAGLTWQLHPAFVAESGMRYDMAGAASVVGQVVTTRRSFPTFSDDHFDRVFGVVYSSVLSAQVLLDSAVANAVTQETPDLLFAYYPFYLSDPLGFVRDYIDDVTAAGVIPDYLLA